MTMAYLISRVWRTVRQRLANGYEHKFGLCIFWSEWIKHEYSENIKMDTPQDRCDFQKIISTYRIYKIFTKSDFFVNCCLFIKSYLSKRFEKFSEISKEFNYLYFIFLTPHHERPCTSPLNPGLNKNIVVHHQFWMIYYICVT